MGFYTKELIDSSDTYTKYHISAMVHGKDADGQPVPNTQCGKYPYIYLIFDITCTRSNGDVEFLIDNVVWNTEAHPASGRYGYYFQANIGVDDSDLYNILYKNNVTQSNWWNYVSVEDEIEFTCAVDSDTVDLKFYAGGVNGNGCLNGTLPCYGNYGGGSSAGSGRTFLYSIELDVPQNTVTLTYNKNSSVANSPNPGSQQISRTTATTMSSTVTYPFTLQYQDGSTVLVTDEVNRTFSGWNTKSDGTGTMHQNGDSITLSSDTTYYARWGAIPFTVVASSQTATVIFHSNGGSYCANLTQSRSCKGYSDTPGGTLAYTVGTSASLPNSTGYSVNTKSLYAIFNTVNYNASNLPVPTRNKYVFDGWYYDSALTREVGDTLIIDAKTIDLYAGWKEFPVKRHTSNGWETAEQYVWKMTETGWQKIAPIHMLDSNGIWKNISQ